MARWFTYIKLRLNGPEFHARLLRGQGRWDGTHVAAVFDRWNEAVEHRCFSEDVLSTTYPQMASQRYSGRAAMYLLGKWLSESLPSSSHRAIEFFRFPVIDPRPPHSEFALFLVAFLHAATANPGR